MATSGVGRVHVIGNCTLDISFRLPRFPRSGETMLVDEQSQDVGGKGANQAVAATRSGVAVDLCAAVGQDDHGRSIKSRLRAEGVGVRLVRELAVPTDESIIFVTPGGENSIVSTHAAARSLGRDDVLQSLRDATSLDIVLMQGNLSRDLTLFALQQARGLGALTVLNPAPIHYTFDDMWPFVDHAIINEVETDLLSGQTDAVGGARFLMDRGVGHVVVTLGAAGAVTASDRGVDAIAAERVDAVDTTGAGDVFCGVFAAGLALAQPLDAAAGAAVRAATLSVTRRGTQSAFPTPAELDRIMTEVGTT